MLFIGLKALSSVIWKNLITVSNVGFPRPVLEMTMQIQGLGILMLFPSPSEMLKQFIDFDDDFSFLGLERKRRFTHYNIILSFVHNHKYIFGGFHKPFSKRLAATSYSRHNQLAFLANLQAIKKEKQAMPW